MNHTEIMEYAKTNYKILNQYQAMLFISNGAELIGTYVSHTLANDTYKMVYVFERNDYNTELLKRFHNRDLKFGDKVSVY